MLIRLDIHREKNLRFVLALASDTLDLIVVFPSEICDTAAPLVMESILIFPETFWFFVLVFVESIEADAADFKISKELEEA